VGRTDEEADGEAGEWTDHDAGLVLQGRRRGNEEFDAFPDQVGQQGSAVGDPRMRRQPWVIAGQHRQHRQQQRAGRHRAETETDFADVASAHQRSLVSEASGMLQQGFGPRQEGSAGAGRARALAIPVKQHETGLGFEPGDALAQRRLRDVEPRRGTSVISLGSQRGGMLQFAQVHDQSVWLMESANINHWTDVP
jgi:hypothetical protein